MQQFKVTRAAVKATRGPTAARRLGAEQGNWVNRRDSECEAQAAGSPSTQVARNILSCQTQRTTQRTKQLKALAINVSPRRRQTNLHRQDSP
jgi:uncharacterized protein YecT (DUF1311 family)